VREHLVAFETRRVTALQPEESVESPPRMPFQADWMRSGYVRPEMYEEVRKELDGNDATNERSTRRSKKMLRLDAEAEF
jgi:hypothetical protein